MYTLDFYDHIKMNKSHDYFIIIKVQSHHDTMIIEIPQGDIFSSTKYHIVHMQTKMIHINMSTTKIQNIYGHMLI